MILKIYSAEFLVRSTHISIVQQNLSVTCRKEQTVIPLEAFTYSTV